VRRIEEACIETAIAATVDTAMWPQAHRRSTLTGKAVKRSSRSYQSLLTISITMLPFAVITGMFFWDLDLIPLMLWSVIAPILPLIAFATADLTLRIREERAFTAPKNDAATRVDIDEESTFVRSGIFFAILYLIAGIVYKASAQ
jgi:hypothetical protein